MSEIENPSAVFEALDALEAVLLAKSQEAGSPLVAPARDANLLSAFRPTGDGLLNRAWLNLVELDPEEVAQLAGGNDGNPESEFYQHVRIEWLVERKDDGERRKAFDRGLTAIRDALGFSPDPEYAGAGGDRTLGGAVDDIDIRKLTRSELVLTGAPKIKAGGVLVRLLLTSTSIIG